MVALTAFDSLTSKARLAESSVPLVSAIDRLGRLPRSGGSVSALRVSVGEPSSQPPLPVQRAPLSPQGRLPRSVTVTGLVSSAGAAVMRQWLL